MCGQTHPHKNNQERPRGSSVVPATSSEKGRVTLLLTEVGTHLRREGVGFGQEESEKVRDSKWRESRNLY